MSVSFLWNLLGIQLNEQITSLTNPENVLFMQSNSGIMFIMNIRLFNIFHVYTKIQPTKISLWYNNPVTSKKMVHVLSTGLRPNSWQAVMQELSVNSSRIAFYMYIYIYTDQSS